eukprot:7285823-Pyramimonas_sp.AAC.1
MYGETLMTVPLARRRRAKTMGDMGDNWTGRCLQTELVLAESDPTVAALRGVISTWFDVWCHRDDLY